MHSFRLQNRSRLSLQFMLKSQFCSDWLIPPFVCSERFSHFLDTLCPCCTLICAYCNCGQGRFFFVLRALRKCSCHDRDSLSMLDPLPMIEFLELRACLVRIKGRHALKWGTCSNSNTGSTVYSGVRVTYRYYPAEFRASSHPL